ncbi:ATP-binding protein [Desulfomonile tiedjei]|uniref:histidine kinase n=1 Tax=Desulfomonile tiedjei (strain ATCC 49306 / DSM 6799 / DCB-1) TaxID=706587 RepID=I4C019_DESTA|nr:ATP-binding protein [Desulfomonile tiedjei]AFM22910.1 PAS domain S-box [Desulfomonile tiedjei DSM 6799]
MPVLRAKNVQRTIVYSSALGIFVVGLIVALVSIYPLYLDFKSEEELNLTLALNTKTLAIEECLARAKDVALQISSRSVARQMLEAYYGGSMTLEAVSDFTREVLSDAISFSHEVWGITRLDKDGKIVAQIGIELPKEFWPPLSATTQSPTLHGPAVLGINSYLVVSSPILDRQSQRLGTDILAFRLFHLARIVEDYIGLGKTGETVIGVDRPDGVELVFPLRRDKGAIGGTISKDSDMGRALSNAIQRRSGVMIPRDGNDVIAYGPIRDINWGVVVSMDQDELYAPVTRRIWATSKIIVALILLGTLAMVLLVRPLTGKLIIHTDELAREIQEKTESLKRELEGRKRMEKWLIDSERRYRVLLEEVPDIIFILDREGRFSYVNTQVEKFLDYPVFQILETPLIDYVVPHDRPLVETLLQTGMDQIWDEEVEMMAAGMVQKFARIRCKVSLVEDHGPVRYEGVMRDITRRKGLEEELRASREELLEKIKIIDDLYEHIVQQGKSKAIADHTAEVAHELRQPLAIIGGFARRLSKHFESCLPQDGGQRRSCEMIISEIQRLEGILTSLINFTRHERIRLEKVDPTEIIERVLRVYDDRMRERQIKLITSFGKELAEVMLDPNRFEQVVRNLISNAIEASAPGEAICIETGAYVLSGKAQETGGLAVESYFEMKVKNWGKVIPPDELSKIFSPFYTTKNYGTGIGLTLCKKIIEDHNGSISVRSDNEGTVFTIWLPLEHTARLPAKATDREIAVRPEDLVKE